MRNKVRILGIDRKTKMIIQSWRNLETWEETDFTITMKGSQKVIGLMLGHLFSIQRGNPNFKYQVHWFCRYCGRELNYPEDEIQKTGFCNMGCKNHYDHSKSIREHPLTVEQRKNLKFKPRVD